MSARAPIICIAGFGDNASVFEPLIALGARHDLDFIGIDLPGFGAPPERPTSLASLAAFLATQCRLYAAETVVAHSLASIIASLAATAAESSIRRIISLEGNLTREDAYFSGTAANYPDPSSFREAFLNRLEAMSGTEPKIAAYAERVRLSDIQAAWELGCDAHRFSQEHVPGEILREACDVHYIYNPANCPAPSLDWLAASGLRTTITDVSHWPMIDAPQSIINAIEQAPA